MAQQQLRIVVAEDQLGRQELLVDFLRTNEMHATGISSGIELMRVMDEQRADVLLLNVAMAHEDGTQMLKCLQDMRGVHVVGLSSNDSDENRILAFEGGVDNYLVTPINLRLLIALLRRIHARHQVTSWRLQPSERHLHTPGGIAMELSVPEVCLLEILARANGRTVPRRKLIESLGHDFLSYDERRLEVGLSRLRKKIRHVAGVEAPVKSGRGVGYAFTERCVVI